MYSEGFGFADYENKVPMTTSHIMRVASISKEITDAGLNMLFAEGKLDIH